MLRKRSTALLVLTAMLLAVLLTACGAPPAVEEQQKEPESEAQESLEPRYGGVLKTTINSDPGSLDMHLEGSEQAQIPGCHVFETLLAQDTKGNAHPLLCSYEVKEDGLVIELTMRENVKFHNGDVMDIDDVMASINRWLNTVSSAKSMVGNKLESLTAVDDKTIVFKFKEPAPLALTAMSTFDRGPYVMPKEIIEKYGDQKITEYIGTGPYKFVEHLADRHIKLERFEDYQAVENDADGMAAPRRAYVDEIYFIPVKDKMTRITGVQTGDYDVGIGVPSNLYPTLKEDPNLKVVMQDMEIFPTMVLNYEEGPTTDIKLRQAILACLDMEELMIAAEGDPDFFYLHPCFMPKSSAFWNDAGSDKYNNPDPERAKKLLEESSYNGETLIYITTKDFDYFYKTALLASDMMRKVGINVDLQVVDNATLGQLRNDPSAYSMFSAGLTSKPDPTLIAFMEDGWAGFYKSEKKSHYYNILTTEFDPKTRMQAWREMSEVLYEEVPAITFGERKVATVTNKKVNNLFEGTKKYYWNTWVSE
ncbi:MAG: ABC transporter substrate-binding protein [Mahellales bacterium]|jgi:peptide/nickel transport system substrate-binding protein